MLLHSAPRLARVFASTTRVSSRTFASAIPAVPFRTHVGAGPVAHTFFHRPTWTWQYVVADPKTSRAVLIDPVLDFDPVTNTISTTTADSLLAFIASKNYRIERTLETHAHADHLTAARYIQRRLGGVPLIGIGAGIKRVQAHFGQVYGVQQSEMEGAFDELFVDGDRFQSGELDWEVMHLPGHTPDHIGLRCGDFVFVGDSLFLPDVGSARADFPGGSVEDLYASSQRLLALPPTVRVFSGHDYPGADREKSCSSTVGEQRAANKHLKDGTDAEAFIAMRKERDATLGEPRLLHQSLQVNIRGGRLPAPDAEGNRFLKLPLHGAEVLED